MKNVHPNAPGLGTNQNASQGMHFPHLHAFSRIFYDKAGMRVDDLGIRKPGGMRCFLSVPDRMQLMKKPPADMEEGYL
jgi:hypothetical protein